MNEIPASQKFQNVVEDEANIIERIVGGDTALFEILVRRYNTVLYRIAMSYGFNHQDAEDLMQDSHVAAYAALRKFENRSTYKTWLCRIMINKCNYRKQYGYTKYEVSQPVQNNKITPMYMQENNHTGDVFQKRELAGILEKSISSLPEMYRTVFVLREIEGFSVNESAEVLGITPVNVKVRLTRAKSMLQQEIEKTYSLAEIYSFNLIYCDAIVKNVFKKILEYNID